MPTGHVNLPKWIICRNTVLIHRKIIRRILIIGQIFLKEDTLIHQKIIRRQNYRLKLRGDFRFRNKFFRDSLIQKNIQFSNLAHQTRVSNGTRSVYFFAYRSATFRSERSVLVELFISYFINIIFLSLKYRILINRLYLYFYLIIFKIYLWPVGKPVYRKNLNCRYLGPWLW